MPRSKRSADEAQLDHVEPEVPVETQEMLTRLRNMWEFASLMQYIFLFGHVMKIDEDFDVEDLEAECLQPTPSVRLAEIGLQLLKYVSSHRGLTLEIFDEYTRRQYTAKAPQRNPFGEDEEPAKFNEMDIYTRIKVLQQLSIWTFGNADRMRSLMPQDEDHLNWRMEPLGWDREDRSYYVLDDNRLYRRSDERVPPPTPKPKAVKNKAKGKGRVTRNSKSRATRTSKRRRIEDSDEEEHEENSDAEEQPNDDTVMTNGDSEQTQAVEESGHGFTSKTWECIAITLEEYQEFMASIFRSRDPNERALRTRIEEDVLPIIEKRAEALRQKELKKFRELENLQKMATAKRSSRLADKAERDKQEREEREVEEKRQADLRMAREEQERQKRIEEGHESRRLTREQRVREREAKRILHEEELARLEAEGSREQSQGIETDLSDGKRASERQRKTQREQHQKELEKLAEDDGNWYFDCSICGKHGENMDDGSHSIACDRCSVWQHSKCHGFSPKQAEGASFTFVCGTCKRKEEDAKKPKIPPLKLSNRSSKSPETQKSRSSSANNALPDHVTRQLDSLSSQGVAARPSPGPFGQITNGPSLSPGYRYPPVGNFAPYPPQSWQSNGYHPHNQGSYARPAQHGSPSSHQQHHHYAHHNAVVSAGGHPTYQHQQQHIQQGPPASGHVQRGSIYGSSPQQYQTHQHAPQQQHPSPQASAYYQPSFQPQQHIQQPERPRSNHQQQHMNGFQSPGKPDKPLFASPPAQPLQPPAQLTQQRSSPHVQNSPNTYLPPPQQHYEQRPGQSPVKSSPQNQPPRAPTNLQSPNPPALVQPPPGTNGHCNKFETPQMQRLESLEAPHSNSVAADGMSGPWPAGSQVIPKKHDQSPAPAPPPAAQTKIFPPNTPLAPSPQHQQQPTGADSIPVKKLGAQSPQ